ncbi:hypothetical protein GCM10009826_05260 [Humibacillus xanthopallidus]
MAGGGAGLVVGVGFAVGVGLSVTVGSGVSGCALVVGTAVEVGDSEGDPVGDSVGELALDGGAVADEDCATFVGLAVTAASGVHAVAVSATAIAAPTARSRRATPALVVTCCMVFPLSTLAPLPAPIMRTVTVDRTLNRLTRPRPLRLSPRRTGSRS